MSNRLYEYDLEQILDEYDLIVPPLPERDDTERRWCVAPYCRNDATPRTYLCRGHGLLLVRGGWKTADLIARELVRAARPGAGCANPACPTPRATEPAQKTPMSGRTRQYAPRRYWAFTPGGEFLCRVCSGILSPIVAPFIPGESSLEKLVAKTENTVRHDIPHATYEKLTGQAKMRAQKMPASALTLADGFTLEQFVTGLVQYAGFWGSIAEDRWILTARPGEAREWITSIEEAHSEAVDRRIAAGELPDHAIPYTPSRIVVDAMLGEFPRT